MRTVFDWTGEWLKGFEYHLFLIEILLTLILWRVW